MGIAFDYVSADDIPAALEIERDGESRESSAA